MKLQNDTETNVLYYLLMLKGLMVNSWFSQKEAGVERGFAQRFAGQPFKSVALKFTDDLGQSFARRGEFVATQAGVEGSLIYAVSALLRDCIARQGQASLKLDLLPQLDAERVRECSAHAARAV